MSAGGARLTRPPHAQHIVHMLQWLPLNPYQALSPAERAWCDSVVHEIEAQAARADMPLALYLQSGVTLPRSVTDRDTKGMMQRRDVQFAITERLQENARNNDLSRPRWEKELMAIAFANIQNYISMDDDGVPVWDFSRCTPEQMAAIESIKIKRGGRKFTVTPDDIEGMMVEGGTPSGVEIEVKFHNKIAALKLLGESAGYLDAEGSRMAADRRAPLPVTANDTAESAADKYQRMLEG